MMKLQCQLTPRDYIQAQFLHSRPRPILKWIGLFLVGLALVVCVDGFLNLPESEAPWRPFIIFAALLYFALFYGVWLPFRTRRLFSQQKALQEPYEVDISDDAFSASSSHGQTTMVWKDFHKYKTNKKIILLYQSDALFHMFPMRWFSGDQFSEFQEILRANLGEPRPTKRGWTNRNSTLVGMIRMDNPKPRSGVALPVTGAAPRR